MLNEANSSADITPVGLMAHSHTHTDGTQRESEKENRQFTFTFGSVVVAAGDAGRFALIRFACRTGQYCCARSLELVPITFI